MAILGDSQRKRQEESTEASSDSPSVAGWNTIQDSMTKYDEATMKDFTDDIDTLLVFAGLFSAVLTAFVVESYQSLQPDDSQTSVQLLSQISAQLGAFTTSQPIINATVLPNPATPFQATTSAIALNVLWFLSLVFSVAAALFGIFVKQWIREYLRWNSVLGSSRDNVLIRQMRYEAWERWKVPAIISAIPALLEMGVLLFFAGMIVFLWTLETTVAAVVTIAIGAFLAMAILVTVLPSFSRTCPYRSPTGWAYVVLAQSLQRYISPIYRLLLWRRGRRQSRFITGRRRSTGWRRFLLSDALLSWKDIDLEVMYLASAEVAEAFRPWGRDMMHNIGLDICELDVLLRALAWFARSSSIPNSLKSISQCVQSVHTRRTHPRSSEPRYILDEAGIDCLSTIHIIFPSSMGRTVSGNKLDDSVTKTFYATPCRWDGEGRTIQYQRVRWSSLWAEDIYVRVDPVININSQITGRLALYELRAQIKHWMMQLSGSPPSSLDLYSGASGPVHETVLETPGGKVNGLLYILIAELKTRIYTHEYLAQDLVFILETIDIFTEMYDTHASNPLAHRTGLTTIILEMLCMLGKVGFSLDGRLTVSLPQSRRIRMSPENAVPLAQDLYNRNVNAANVDEEGLHLFVAISDFVLPIFPASLFPSMLATAEWSLSAGKLNCGAFIDLPWVDSLLATLKSHNEARILKDQEAASRTVILLLLTLLKSHYAGLVTGEDVRSKLESCLAILPADPSSLDVEYILEDSILLRECLETGGQSRANEGLAEESRYLRKSEART